MSTTPLSSINRLHLEVIGTGNPVSRLLFRFRLEIDFRSVDVGDENKEIRSSEFYGNLWGVIIISLSMDEREAVTGEKESSSTTTKKEANNNFIHIKCNKFCPVSQ